VASRCTASFPGAFEPFWVDVPGGGRVGDRWQSSAGLANFAQSQFVVDGGLLLNKPIRPAIEAVYRQAAAQQVRRVLAYVVPDPGEAPPPAPTLSSRGTPDPAMQVPHAGDVLLGVLTRLRSTDSVSRELDEIQRRNDDARYRRRTRDRLAAALVLAGAVGDGGPHDIVAAAFPGYREVRKEDAARTIAARILAVPGDTGWSRRELAAELRILADGEAVPFIPDANYATAMAVQPDNWRWGSSTVRRLGDLVIDVLKRAVWLAPLSDEASATPVDDARREIVAARAAAHDHLQAVREMQVTLDAFWAARNADLPARSSDPTASRAELAALRTALDKAVKAWIGANRLGAHAAGLAACLYTAKDAVQQVAASEAANVDPAGTEKKRLQVLVEVLLDGAATPQQVLERMLRLEVLQVAFAGVAQQPEQEVELVQLSAVDPTLVTGVQLHHFGAFYRRSWRVNDWMRGRLDGCEQLVLSLRPSRAASRCRVPSPAPPP
jgi:patatin-related protein